MALRAAKIARNQARLKQLGLFKPQRQVRTNTALRARGSSASKPKKTYDVLASVGPRRRSARISGLETNPDYKESSDFRELRGKKRTLDETNPEETNTIIERIPPKPSPRPYKASAPSANSVKTISLDASKLVDKFLAQPMEVFGKYFVIETSFQEAAHTEDQERLSGVPRLSFNKFSGVQPWKNVIFLWINVGGPKSAGSLVNEFSYSDGSCRVSWFGGSRMTEDSPIIQDLIRLGKESASSKIPLDSGILLWCRNYDWEAKKLLPYTCLGRLAYVSHEAGSYPVAFTWRLMDYKTMVANETKRSVFQEISGLE